VTSRFVGLSLPRLGTALVAILVLFAQLFAAISGTDASSTVVPGVISFVMYTLVAGWAIMAEGERLPIAPTVAATAVPSIAAVASDSVVVTFDQDALWHLGAAAFLLLLVVLRGRLVAAWIGMAAVTTTTLIWAGTSHYGVPMALGTLARQVPILVIGTLFIVAVSQLQRRLVVISDEAARLSALEAASAATAEERRLRLHWARSLSAPLLEAIAEREHLEPELRLEAALVEAELRDGLRAPSLAAEPVTSAARRARARGVEVILLDDRVTTLTGIPGAEIRSKVARELNATRSGRFVARLPPDGRTPLATVLVDGPEGRRLELD